LCHRRQDIVYYINYISYANQRYAIIVEVRSEKSKEKREGRAKQDEVPVELRRLWGVGAPEQRLGRPAELNLRRVVQTGVTLADRQGLRGASLPKIAKALGHTTMSLYRHVGSKDELLMLMRDFAVGVPPEIPATEGVWREPLRRWACEQRLLYRRRPWLARVPVSGPPSGPNQVAWMEAGLQILRGTGLDWAEKVGVLTLVSMYVLQMSLLSQDLEHGRKGTGINQAETEARYRRNLVKLIDPQRFPEMARLFASGLFEAPPKVAKADPMADPDFTFGLERILDGTAVTIAHRQSPSGNG
jgi:AcrR family transcriptional regulator